MDWRRKIAGSNRLVNIINLTQSIFYFRFQKLQKYLACSNVFLQKSHSTTTTLNLIPLQLP